MKKKLVIGFGLLTLIACSGNQNENSNNDLNTDTTEIIEPINSYPITIFEFPDRWYALNGGEDGSDYYINQWCDSDTRQVLFTKDENDAWSFTFNYGQEQVSWELMNFEANAIVYDSLDYVEGSFSLIPYKESTTTADAVIFYWNRAEKWCDFNGDVIGLNRFVNEEEKGSYELVEEDCSDFWEE
jgi:hypothetical protein